MENKSSFNIGEKVKRKDNGLTYIVTGSNMAFGHISTVFLDGEFFGVSPKILEKLDGNSLNRNEIVERLEKNYASQVTKDNRLILNGNYRLKTLKETVRLFELLVSAKE